MNADVNGKILDMIKAGQVFGAVNLNQGIQGYMGFMLLFNAAHPDLIDPMNDWKRSGYNPMGVPFVDNGFAVVTKDNADDFYWDAYLKRARHQGHRGIIALAPLCRPGGSSRPAFSQKQPAIRHERNPSHSKSAGVLEGVSARSRR